MKTYQLILACFLLVEISCQHQSWSSDNSHEEQREHNEIGRRRQLNLKFDFVKYRHIALVHEFSYHAAIIKIPEKKVLCQGAIVNDNWILTSATCYLKNRWLNGSLLVVAGATNIQDPTATYSTIVRSEFHPSFQISNGVNDLVLIKVTDSLIPDHFNEQTTRIQCTKFDFVDGTQCDYSCYEGTKLYGFRLNMLPLSACPNPPDAPNQVLSFYCVGIDDTQFITNSRFDYKFSYLGAPLVCEGLLLGIKTHNGFFTAVKDVKSWIDEKTIYYDDT